MKTKATGKQIAADKNRRLCEAVRADDLKGAAAALADGANINARVLFKELQSKRFPLASTAQAALAWAYTVPMAELLLDAGANIDGTDEQGYTALRRAVLNSRSFRGPLIELFLRRGANPSVLEDVGGGGLELAQMLLDAGAKVTPLALSRARHQPDMIAMLEEWPIRSSVASVETKELMLAARAGSLETVTALLAKGASAITRDAYGATAIDHAWRAGHLDLAVVLERAAVSSHAQAELFLAVLDDHGVRVSNAAARGSLEARTESGLTTLMLAAKYRRHTAVRELVALGAKLDPEALVLAVASGDLDGLQLLFELGVPLATEQATLVRVACLQPDSDLLKHLLLRGLDISPYPDLRTASTESDRLLRNARAGLLPPESPTAASSKECVLCRDLRDVEGWHCRTHESMGELPKVTERFETFGFERDGLWKCPHCTTYYAYERDHDNGMTDGYDCEWLRRISPAKALEEFRAIPAKRPQIAREIAALTVRVTFDEAVAVTVGKVQVPDEEGRNGRRTLLIYSLSSEGAKRLAYRYLSEAEQDALVADLKSRGLAVAESDSSCDFVWVRNGNGIEVYDSKCKVLEAVGDRAMLADRRVVERADVARVIAFAGDDMVHRGVKATLRSGKEVDLVTDISMAAHANAEGWPTYSRNELICETGWCSTIGAAVAAWAGTGFENLI